MTDIALILTQGDGDFAADVGVAGGDLIADEGLGTAVAISIFTDAPAAEDDVLPGAPGGDRRGWWGDAYAEIPGDITGSKLWLLERAKQTPDVLVKAKEYAQAALAWMIEDGVAASVEVTPSFPARGQWALQVEIDKPAGPKFSFLWANPQ